MICFIMRMDKRLRVQLFFLALIVVSERFAEGDDSTVPAPTGRKCHECSDDECDDPSKVTTRDCTSLCLSAVSVKQDGKKRNLRKCSSWPEAQCVFDSFSDHCFLPKSNPDQLKKVIECTKASDPQFNRGSAEGYDTVCFCDGELCNSENVQPPGTTGGGGGSGSGGSGTTEDSGGSTTANSTSVRIHTRPFIPFSLAFETIVVAAGLKMNV